jgi:hypothetical protein
MTLSLSLKSGVEYTLLVGLQTLRDTGCAGIRAVLVGFPYNRNTIYIYIYIFIDVRPWFDTALLLPLLL